MNTRIYTCEDLLRKSGGDWRSAFRSEEPKEMWVTLTAEQALQILNHKRHNRDLYRNHVNGIIRMMHMGTFDPTRPGCVIGFDKNGQLYEGMHRLTAQARAGTTITWRVVLGVSEELIQLPDVVRVRSMPDQLQAFVEEPYVRDITEGKSWKSRQASSIASTLYTSFVSEKNPCLEDTLSILKFYREEIIWTVNTIGADRTLRRAAFMSATVLARRWAHNNEALDVFEALVNGLHTGEMIDGPMLVFRKYLIALMPQGTKQAEVHDSQWVIFIKSLRAFQMLLTEEPFTKMRPVNKSNELREWFLGEALERTVRRLKLSPLRRFLKDAPSVNLEESTA